MGNYLGQLRDRSQPRAAMKQFDEQIIEGEHNGVRFGIEVREYATGQVEVVRFTVDPYRPISVPARQMGVKSVGEAFEVGAKLAREFIDRA